MLRWSSCNVCSLNVAFTFALPHGLIKARQSWPLVLKVTLGIWLVSQHGWSGITDALGDSDSNLAYETQEQELRSMDFYPLDFKGQISKKKADHVSLHLKTVCWSEKWGLFFHVISVGNP